MPDYFINEEKSLDDDDDVFSDSAPIQTPRGNMCTPYIERKGSLPAVEALPDWFPDSRLILLSHSRFPFFTFDFVSTIFHSIFCCRSTHSFSVNSNRFRSPVWLFFVD